MTRTEFLALSSETVFSYFDPNIFRGLYVKGPSLAVDGVPSDFFLTSLTETDRILGGAFDFFTSGRDGSYDACQLFAVWDDNDVRALIARLEIVLGVTPGDTE